MTTALNRGAAIVLPAGGLFGTPMAGAEPSVPVSLLPGDLRVMEQAQRWAAEQIVVVDIADDAPLPGDIRVQELADDPAPPRLTRVTTTRPAPWTGSPR